MDALAQTALGSRCSRRHRDLTATWTTTCRPVRAITSTREGHRRMRPDAALAEIGANSRTRSPPPSATIRVGYQRAGHRRRGGHNFQEAGIDSVDMPEIDAREMGAGFGG